ncbi:MAG: hypothetical protein RLZZ500_651 [Bacteroidota bacterium]|jgi:hypothetical protein
MKKLITFGCLLGSLLSVQAQDLEAGLTSTVSLNTTSSPDNSSVTKSEKKVNAMGFRYYYYPNMSAYFDTVDEEYVFYWNKQWMRCKELPEFIGGYSMYKMAKVRIDTYCDEHPEEMIRSHQKQFPYVTKGRFPYKTE